MKTKFLILLFVASVFLTAFTVFTDKGTATVDQQQGLYIFMLSKPQLEYEYLGSVKKTLAWSGKPEEMLSSMIKKVKKDYPNADGIMFTSIEMDKADAIKLKAN